MRQRLRNLVRNLDKARILVLGDLMIDVFVWGRVSRISPEAPVPVVDVMDESLRLGGAANVVNNLVALDIKNVLVTGVVGDDEMGQRLRNEIKRLGICGEGLVIDESRPTTVKTRIIAHSQQVVRVDREKRHPISSQAINGILDFVSHHLDEIDAILISDYAKGVICAPLMEGLKDLIVQRGVLITVDPKVKNMPFYKGVTLITPNHYEALQAAGLNNGIEEITDDVIAKVAHKLMGWLSPQALLITRGESGMTLFEGDGSYTHIPAMAKKVFDVTGAGDTVIATLTAAWATGSSLKEAAYLANLAAGIVVGELGTATVSRQKLLEALQ